MAKDIIQLNGFNKVKMPKFKGHVKITLHNCRTGKNEVIEGENIVTNAVRDILANNYLSSLDPSTILPIWRNWFGGVLCYEQAHTLNADNYFPKSDSESHLFAHAGDQSIDSSHDDDLTRGNPVSAAYTYAENAIKQVWEWGSARGNVPDGRYIRSIALTHKDVGNVGLGSNTYGFQNFSPFEDIGNVPNASIYLNSPDSMQLQYDDYHGLYFYIGDKNGYTYGNTLKTGGTNKIVCVLRRFPYSKTGLYDTLNADNTQEVAIEITTSVTFYNMPSWFFDYENKKLWLFTNINSGGRSHNSTTVNYTVLDLSDLTDVSEDTYGTIVSDTSNLAPTGMEQTSSSYNPSVPRFANIVKDGNYVYLPTTSGAVWNSYSYGYDQFNINGFKKINISNQSEQSQITFDSVQTQLRSFMFGGGLLVGSGKVVNGANSFPCVSQLGDAGWDSNPNNINWSCYAFNEPQKISSLVLPIGACSGTRSMTRKIFANKLVNTTLFNLPSPVQKTSSQSMTIEYTLTEVTSNE